MFSLGTSFLFSFGSVPKCNTVAVARLVQYWTMDGSTLLFETLPRSEFTLSVCVLFDVEIRVNGTEIKLYISTYDEGVLHVLH